LLSRVKTVVQDRAVAKRCPDCRTVYMDSEVHSCEREYALRDGRASYSDTYAFRKLARGLIVVGLVAGAVGGATAAEAVGAGSLGTNLIAALAGVWGGVVGFFASGWLISKLEW
jgi:hypothetical protein